MHSYYFLKTLMIPAAGICLLVSCKKEGNNDNPDVAASSNVIVVHAAPVTAAYPTLNVYLDTGKLTTAPLGYLANTQATGITGNLLYSPVFATAGSELNIRPSTNPALKVLAKNTVFDLHSNYSFFIYDTLNTATNAFKLLQLTDDLSEPADTSLSKIRFLHLAPNAAAYDVTLVRLAGTAEIDSITLTNRSYIGNGMPNEAVLSIFTNLKGGIYRAKLKLAGTSTVAFTINNAATNYLNFSKGKGYTVFIAGTAMGLPLALRSIRHF